MSHPSLSASTMTYTVYRRIQNLGSSRGSFVRNAVSPTANRVLDIGCAFGWDLAELKGQAEELVGVDLNEDSINKARSTYPDIRFLQASATDLPFESDTFDVAILSEVIEHVGETNKQAVVDEAFRVLRPGGTLIFTAPFDGITAWADPLDFKRRFPSIYRVYMRVSGYSPKTDLDVGHKHVSLDEIKTLFDDRFEFSTVQFCGLFSPFITWILTAGERTGVFPNWLVHRLNRLRAWEDGVTYPQWLAYNIRLIARKRVETPTDIGRTTKTDSVPVAS